ncbi:helix-turn-helix domain-containing protein [Rhizobium sp. 32-5/1]|uniref:helix-turn-helix domain-containing protein n=1 Tax=Rhizobium sp. 32-5/1 TaxID=3019602 RepID=UPI00240D69F6|nr:helix-turn-helix domain-containing protein [Rhizobium sp. 32-5/1]WEZ82193.1 helix-turn-helix domain-containing protein [Rhizobium sp. 32-5/1]
MIRLLTQAEAAKRMGVSVEKLKRLRGQGMISYIPGRPVLFDEKDVDEFAAAYAERKRVKAALKVPGSPEYLEKKRQDAEGRHCMRIRVMMIHREMARKRGGK